MNLTDYHAGQLEDRYEYSAFLPEQICHEWIIADPELADLLGRADRALGELNAFAQLVPDINFFIQMYVAKEATQSSRIEGTQTNIEDAFKDHAINEAIAALDTLPLSNRLLRDTHAILMQGVRGEHKRPGEFRVSQNWIGVSLKNASFVPPHHDHVPDLMSDLERFLHNQGIFVHPLIRIAIAHYQFETIHPFLDGNGRLGRLMISLYLASENLLVKPALYLSDYFERNKTAYVDHLMAVRQGHHMRAWLIFFLAGIEETAKASAGLFREILDLKTRIDGDILPRFSVRRQENAVRMMRHLYAHPVIDVKRVADIVEVSNNTASALINDMVSHGILNEITGQRRNRLFLFNDYLALFRR